MKNLKKEIAGMAVALTLAIVATVGVSRSLSKQNPNFAFTLENVEAIACTAIETDLNGTGTWCNCKDEKEYCGTTFSGTKVNGIKEERVNGQRP